jgi:phage terminase small subunit
LGLTAQEVLFIAAFMNKPNGAQAARAAGYSERNARRIAWRMLRKPIVKLAIELEQARTLRLGRLTKHLTSRVDIPVIPHDKSKTGDTP